MPGPTQVLVTGQYFSPVIGDVADGQVVFQLTDEIEQAGWGIVPAVPIIVPLVNGALASPGGVGTGVTLYANDDPATTPGTAYEVVEEIGPQPWDRYLLVVSHTAPGGTLSLTGS